jgi:cytoskeletal protein RodZ
MAVTRTSRGTTLGQVLRRARDERSLTLRDVQRATGISNGYLSLLESDSVKNPSPNYLAQLAETLSLPYVQLLQLAGYAVPETAGGAADASTTAPVLSDLSDDELTQVDTFVRFLRASRRR